MNEDIKLISCGKHERLPWSILCIHLIDDPTLEWIPIPHEDDDRYDYICTECDKDFDRMMNECDIENLRPVCIKCVEDIRSVFDRNYRRGGN